MVRFAVLWWLFFFFIENTVSLYFFPCSKNLIAGYRCAVEGCTGTDYNLFLKKSLKSTIYTYTTMSVYMCLCHVCDIFYLLTSFIRLRWSFRWSERFMKGWGCSWNWGCMSPFTQTSLHHLFDCDRINFGILLQRQPRR